VIVACVLSNVLAIDPESEAVRSCSSPLSLSFVTICHVIIYHEELFILPQLCVLHSLLQIQNGVTQEYGMCMVVHNAPLCVVSPERSIQSHPEPSAAHASARGPHKAVGGCHIRTLQGSSKDLSNFILQCPLCVQTHIKYASTLYSCW
jgi:hypothetical protein